MTQKQEKVLTEPWEYVKHHEWCNEKNYLAGETEAQRHKVSCPGLRKLMVPEAGVKPVLPLDLPPTRLATKSAFLSAGP